MDTLTMMAPREVTPDTLVLPAWVPVPGLGLLAANAFLVRAAEPVLIDAGVVALRDEFVARLRSVIDLAEIRWLWLTHVDPDHVGGLSALLAAAPRLRIVTSFLGLGKLGLRGPLPPDRVYLLNPGQELDVGDRRLLGVRPPIYDAPETTAAYDASTRTLFSADMFGAVLDEPAERAEDIDPAALREGMIRWATIDAPWLHQVREDALGAALDGVRRLDPERILSAHLPPARGLAGTMLGNVAEARTAPPFVGPDQAAMVAMMGAPT